VSVTSFYSHQKKRRVCPYGHILAFFMHIKERVRSFSMKNTFKVLGIIGLMLVIGFSMVACGGSDDDSGGGSNNPNPIKFISTDTAGNTYTLIITPAVANTIAAGNSYELTIKSGQTSKVSKGTITFVTGSGVLTMQPKTSGSVTFTITVTGSGQMTNISGTIAVEGGETVTGPGQVTPEGGGGNNPGSGGGDVNPFFGEWYEPNNFNLNIFCDINLTWDAFYRVEKDSNYVELKGTYNYNGNSATFTENNGATFGTATVSGREMTVRTNNYGTFNLKLK